MLMPGIIPISEIRKRQAKVLAEIVKRPVVLTQRGRGVAVLVSLDQWEELLAQLPGLDQAANLGDEETLKALYAEFAEEERELVNLGLSHYSRMLQREEGGL